MTTTKDQTVAAGHSLAVDPGHWQELLDELMGRVAGRFARVELRRRAKALVRGLLADLPRKNYWTIAEHAGGALVELLRLGPARRPVFGLHLQERVPSLLNSPGIDVLDGVPVGPPRWDENKPLRHLPPVVNTVPGAMPIQELIDRTEWAFQPGNSLAYAPHLRREPLPGVPAKSVLLQFAKGDQTSPNPAMTAFLRASGLANRTTFYRNDLAFAEDNRVPKNPHGFLINLTSPIPLVAAVSRGAQQQMGTFFASNGKKIITPEPARLFEVPIAPPLPEVLSFIP